MPGPWSRTTTSPSRTRHLDLAARRAPLRRVVEQVRDRALDRRRDAADDRLLELGLERDAGTVPARPLDRVRRRRGRAARPPGRPAPRRRARARRARRSAPSSPSSCSVTSREQLLALAAAAAPRPRASTSMFVRRLVSGVRSSCDASETSWRCARAESSSAASIVLKRRREPRELVAAGGVDPAREVRVSETSSAVCVSRCTGASSGPRDDEAEPGGERDPDRRAIRKSSVLIRSSARVDLLERARDLERDAGTVDRERVARGGASPATSASAKNGSRSPAGDARAPARSTGRSTVARRGADRAAVGA